MMRGRLAFMEGDRDGDTNQRRKLPGRPSRGIARRFGEARKTIKAAAPKATEKISYQMPAFEENGRFLVSYAAFKNHCSLFPASNAVMAALGEELKPYSRGRAPCGSPQPTPPPPPHVKEQEGLGGERRGRLGR